MSGKILAFTAAILAVMTFDGCSLRSWWGEKGPAREAISMPDTKPSCGDLAEVLTGSEERSLAVFDCLQLRFSSLWENVEGHKKNSLSDEEFSILVRKGVLGIHGDREDLLKRVFTLKNMLGIKPGLIRAEVDSWLDVARKVRGGARYLFQKIKSRNEPFFYSDLELGVAVSAPVLSKAAVDFNSREVADLWISVLGLQDRDIVGTLPAGLDFAINILNAVCPNFSVRDRWNSVETSQCLQLLVGQFKGAAAWFDFATNPDYKFNLKNYGFINESINSTESKLTSWFDDPRLGYLETRRLIDLSKGLGVDPPTKFIDSLGLVSKFHNKSSGKLIHPTFLQHDLGLMANFHRLLLESMPVFTDASERHKCLPLSGRREPYSWRECVPTDIEAARKKYELVDLVLRVKNTNYGGEAVPLDGRMFSRILLFYILSGEIVRVFDNDGDGIISTNIGNNDDELVHLLSTGVQGYEVIKRFTDNVGRKFKGLMIEPGDPTDRFNKFDITGLARLITMTNDVLVVRTRENEDFLKGIFSYLFNIFPKSSVFMDQMAVTAVTTTLDSLADYRKVYLSVLGKNELLSKDDLEYQRPGLVHRDDITKFLPEMLKRNFPRTYESCTEFGFERSCGIAFDEIIPSAESGSAYVSPDDLDILTIVAISIEGLLDTCDKNGDKRLSWKVIDGKDELDCGYTRFKDVVQRLMEANVIHASAFDKAKVNFMLEAINSIFVTRIMGKISIVKGNNDWLVLNLPFFWAYNHATIGSVYGLISDTLNEKRVRAEKKKKK